MNNKWWSCLFGAVMLACAGLFVVAPMVGWWLPPALSSHAHDIDFLFYLILGITGFFFVLTEALLIYFMFRYAGREPGQLLTPSPLAKLFEPVTRFFDSAHKIEMAWTVVPAVILLYLAFAQVSTWADVKYKSRLDTAVIKDLESDKLPVQIDVSARQFEWRMRYPSPQTWKDWKQNPALAQKWVKQPEFDDVHLVNDLHVIKDRHAVVQLSTKDVIHSFNSPHMRIKQDALPGKIIPVWFKPIASNVERFSDGKGGYVWYDGNGRDPDTGKPRDTSLVWDIACAELCGWGHYRMIGKIYVHPNEQDWLNWLESAAAQERSFGSSASAGR